MARIDGGGTIPSDGRISAVFEKGTAMLSRFFACGFRPPVVVGDTDALRSAIDRGTVAKASYGPDVGRGFDLAAWIREWRGRNTRATGARVEQAYCSEARSKSYIPLRRPRYGNKPGRPGQSKQIFELGAQFAHDTSLTSRSRIVDQLARIRSEEAVDSHARRVVDVHFRDFRRMLADEIHRMAPPHRRTEQSATQDQQEIASREALRDRLTTLLRQY